MKNGSSFQEVRKMKTKKIFTARITADDELLAMLGPDRVGGMESWFLMSRGASYSVFLFVPDLNKTDVFSFDVLFEDNFLKNNEIKIGDRFPIAIPFPRTLRQIEIIDIQEGEPINNHENKRPVRQSNKSVSQFLSYYLYHHLEPDEVCGEDGWFNIEALFKDLATIGYLVDQDQLETIVNKDGDHRYILSDDKTKLRVNPEHPVPEPDSCTRQRYRCPASNTDASGVRSLPVVISCHFTPFFHVSPVYIQMRYASEETSAA